MQEDFIHQPPRCRITTIGNTHQESKTAATSTPQQPPQTHRNSRHRIGEEFSPTLSSEKGVKEQAFSLLQAMQEDFIHQPPRCRISSIGKTHN